MLLHSTHFNLAAVLHRPQGGPLNYSISMRSGERFSSGAEAGGQRTASGELPTEAAAEPAAAAAAAAGSRPTRQLSRKPSPIPEEQTPERSLGSGDVAAMAEAADAAAATSAGAAADNAAETAAATTAAAGAGLPAHPEAQPPPDVTCP